MGLRSLFLLLMLIPVIPMVLAWSRELQSNSKPRWNETLWLPLILVTLSFLWLLTALLLDIDFSTHHIKQVWLSVLVGVIGGGLSASAASPNKHLVTAATVCVAMEWIFVALIQSSV